MATRGRLQIHLGCAGVAPEALRERMARGHSYALHEAQAALASCYSQERDAPWRMPTTQNSLPDSESTSVPELPGRSNGGASSSKP